MKELRVAHYAQLPCNPFTVEVKNLEQAKLIVDTLSNYDLFQYNNKIKQDYCNMTIVEEFNEEYLEWVDWYDEETGISDIDEYFEFMGENI